MLDTVLKHKSFFKDKLKEAINALINEKNQENNKAFAWFLRRLKENGRYKRLFNNPSK